MAPALAVSVPVASPSLAVSASAGAHRSCCPIPVSSSSSRSLRSQPLRAAAGISGNRLGGGRRSFVVRAVQGQDATIPVPDVTKSTWQSLVMESELPVLVEFTASWCGPCRMIDPIVSKISKDFEGKLKCYKLDTDESPEIASQYGVRSVPTMMLFKGGEKKDAIIGAVPESTLVSSIEKFI